MPSVRDLIDYVRITDGLHIDNDLYSRTRLEKDYEKGSAVPGCYTVAEYLNIRVRPCLPKGTAIIVYDPFGREVGKTALLENLRLR